MQEVFLRKICLFLLLVLMCVQFQPANWRETMLRYVTAALLVLALSGCASMFGDKNDKITIHSKEPDAKILVNGNEVGSGSAVYSMPRGKSAIITATKVGCADRSVPTEQSIDGVTFLNIFVWPGFIVDAATGAMYKADPSDYFVNPDCQAKG